MPSLDTLYLAYRQAKTALFYERRGVGLEAFARFEVNLKSHLSDLQAKLSSSVWFDNLPPGNVFLVPKRLHDSRPKDKSGIPTVQIPTPASLQLDLYTQLRYAPSPELVATEVLYLHEFGPLLDSMLSSAVLGSRLDTQDGRLSRTRRWIFRYWPDDYNRFRMEPIRHAQTLIENPDNTAIIVSGDFTSFYETVNPAFMIADEFIQKVAHHASKSNLPFDQAAYRTATQSLLNYYSRTTALCQTNCGTSHTTGIPIGSLASRLVGNLVLLTFDDRIRQNPRVVSYRRYVDDFVIVARSLTPRDDEVQALEGLIPGFVHGTGQDDDKMFVRGRDIDRPGSDFSLQRRKIRAHSLHGQHGHKFLDAVRSDLSSLVSGLRSFVDESFYGRHTSISPLRLSREAQTVRVLREVDRPKLDRLAMTSRLATLDRISRMIRVSDFRSVMRESLSTVEWVLEDDPEWVEHLDWMYRLLGICIATDDWSSASRLYASMRSVWADAETLGRRVGKLVHVGEDAMTGKTREKALRSVVQYLRSRLEHVIASNLRGNNEQVFLDSLCRGIPEDVGREWYAEMSKTADYLAFADLRAADREEDSARAAVLVEPEQHQFLSDADLLNRMRSIAEFVVHYVDKQDPWHRPAERLFLCTRPPSYFDIAKKVTAIDSPRSASTFEKVRVFVNSVRGTHYRGPGPKIEKDAQLVRIVVPQGEPVDTNGKPSVVQAIVSNFCLDNTEWDAMVCRGADSPGREELPTYSRFQNTARMFGLIEDEARESDAPSLVLFPELAIPRMWIREIAWYCIRRKYALVSGLEYEHVGPGEVRNPVVVVIPGEAIGEATVVQLYKDYPANEERVLLAQRGYRFAALKPELGTAGITFSGPYGRFGLLICSEMLEAPRISKLVGSVELILVPAWNPDTTTFDSLIRGTGRTVHAYVAVSNNGKISDCRIWGPEKPRWREDVARLIRRGEHQVLAALLPVSGLAAFHRGVLSSGPPGGGVWQPLPPGWRRCGAGRDSGSGEA